MRIVVFLLLLISGCESEPIGSPNFGDMDPRPDLWHPQPDLAEAEVSQQPDLAPVPPTTNGPVVYAAGQRHSPVSAAVRDRWKSLIGATRNPKNFVRLCDNLSHKVHLLGCADSAKS